MKISFIGWYGRKNIGDEAFRLAHEVLFPDDQKFYSTHQIEEHSDIIILGGGDVVLPFYLKHIPDGKQFYILGAGLGYESEIEFLKGKNVACFACRNSTDVSLINSMKINGCYVPDLIFAFDALKYVDCCEPLPPTKKKLCMLLSDHISPSSFLFDSRLLSYYEYFRWEMALCVDYLSEFYDIYWLPFSDNVNAKDITINHDVLRRTKNKSNQVLLEYPGTPPKAISILSGMDLVISMKLHGILLSVNLGIPFVNIGFSRKTHLFCHEEGYGDLCVSPFSLTKERLLAAVKNAEKIEIKNRLLSTKLKLSSQVHDFKESHLSHWGKSI